MRIERESLVPSTKSGYVEKVQATRGYQREKEPAHAPDAIVANIAASRNTRLAVKRRMEPVANVGECND